MVNNKPQQRIITLEIQRRPGQPHGRYRIVQTKGRFRRPRARLERQDEDGAWLVEDLETWGDQPSLQGAFEGILKGAGLPWQDKGFHLGRFDLLPDGRCGLQMSEEYAKRVRRLISQN